jgi:N-acetylmuramoyl-L-alanine amidase
MSYKVRQLWLDPAKYHIKAPHAMKAKYITIHNTANDASAANEIAYMLRNSNATSYHVAIDDKEAIESIPFSRNAWHAGDGAYGKGNRESIGIEICYSKSGGKRYEEAEANAIEYTARALVQLGLPASAVKFHQEWSGKNCPHRILDEKRGNAFKQAIAKRYAELKNPKPASKPAAPKPSVKPVEKIKIGSLITKNDVATYSRPDWDAKTSRVIKKGQNRHVYGIDRGWYQLFNGDWLPSEYGENFDYMPLKKPEPVKKPEKVLKRVIVDGKQVGAFAQPESVLRGVSEALDDKAKTITIKDV